MLFHKLKEEVCLKKAGKTLFGTKNRRISTMITEINKDNFEKEVLRSEKPVVADFWAPWCGYCRRLAPAIDRLESEYGDKLKFVKIDTDDNAALADEYGVDTIPTLIVFRDGEAVASAVNPGSQAAVVEWLKEKEVL